MVKHALSALALAAALMTATVTATAIAQAPHAWEIGPVIGGKNYSVNMPRTLSPGREGPTFDFPYPNRRAGHVHYVTTPVDGLRGASSITLRYRIDAAPGVRFVPQEREDREATLSLFLQRAGDNWSARGPYETYRWYADDAKVVPLSPGTHEVTVDLRNDWKAVMNTTSAADPRAFREALAHADKVGFTFGSGGGRGHGVYATGPARFTLLDFEIR